MKKISFKKIVLFLGMFLVIFATVLTAFTTYISGAKDGVERDYQVYNTGWYDEDNNNVNLDALEKSCRIHKKLPVLDVDKTLSFNVRNVDVDVYIEDVCIYKTKKTNSSILDKIYGKTSGSVFVEVTLLEEYGGKTIYLDVKNPYKRVSACKIVHMYLGNGVQIVKHDASIQLGAFCFAAFIFFIGAICLLLYHPMKKNDMVDSSMLYLGVTAFVFGMVMITDSKMLHLIVGHETLYYTMSQMFMLLLPIPMLAFFSKLYGNLNEKVIVLLGTASILDFVIIFILDCMGIADYHENSPFVLLIVAGTIMYLGFATIRDIIRNGNQNAFHNIGVMMIVGSVILDSIMEKSDIFMETSFFTKFGITGFTFMECVQVLWKHIKRYKKGVKAQLVSRLRLS